MTRALCSIRMAALIVAASMLALPVVLSASAAGGTLPPSTAPTPALVAPLMKLLKNLTVQTQPAAPTLDPVNDQLYVPNYGSGSVSIIKGSTNKVVHNVTVGVHPVHVVYDNTTDQLYVLNLGSNSVSVISGATDKVVRTINVTKTLEPVGVFDPANGDVYVLSLVSFPGSYLLSHINRTSYKVTTIAVGPASQVFYDPANSDLITANTVASNLSVIGPKATKATTISLPTGLGPATLTYDAFNHDMYVTDTGFSGTTVPGPTGNVTVLSSKNAVVTTIKVGQLPVLATVDPVSHDVYVVNEGYLVKGAVPNSTVSIIGTANTVLKTLTLGKGGVEPTYNPMDREVFVACAGVNKTYVINTTTKSIVAKLTTKDAPYGTLYDPTNGDVLVIPFNGVGLTLVTVLSPLNKVVKTFTIGSGEPGPLYDPLNGEVYISNAGSGTVTVLR